MIIIKLYVGGLGTGNISRGHSRGRQFGDEFPGGGRIGVPGR
jgi:hypothetical protein